MALKLFYVSSNFEFIYDVYDGMVVCAESEEQARNIHPATVMDNCVMDFFSNGTENKVYSVRADGTFYYKTRFQGKLCKKKHSSYSWHENIRDADVIEIGISSDIWKTGDIIMTAYHRG